jgi:hypothetical protein
MQDLLETSSPSAGLALTPPAKTIALAPIKRKRNIGMPRLRFGKWRQQHAPLALLRQYPLLVGWSGLPPFAG